MVVYALAFVTEIGNLVFLPARDAAIPDVVDEEQLPTANGLVLVSSYGNIPLGAAAFAGLTALSSVLGGPLQRHPYVLVFLLDAVTYLISFAFIRRITLREAPVVEEAEDVSGLKAFTSMFRLPLLRAVLPGLSTVVLGAGALFSLGIVFVEEVLGATTVEFGYLIAIFGVGAGAGVGWVQLRRGPTTVAVVRGGVAAMGVVLTVMSLLSNLVLAYVVAILFGAAASVALVGGITFLQERLEGRERVLGFTAFHVVLRVGMSVSALGAGAAAETVAAVRWPVVGRLPATSVVMFASGVLVILGAVAIRPEPVHQATEGMG